MAILLTDLTETTLVGNGVFDVLMRANKAHLDDEFNKGRIKGPEYATVYLGSLEAVMQTALAFLLQQSKTDAEIALLASQKTLVDAQVASTNSEKLLIDQKIANAVIEGTVLTAQKCKLDAEFDLITAQTLKSAEELALLAQKKVTEAAQTSAVGVSADSVIGRQKDLYLAQTNGFSRDAEQKAAKLLSDSWSIRRSTDEGTVADAVNKLDDTHVGRAIEKMLTGVGA